jgi:hypothetical protein
VAGDVGNVIDAAVVVAVLDVELVIDARSIGQ